MKNMKLFMRRLCAGALPATYSLVVLIFFAFIISSCNKKMEQKALDPSAATNQNSLKSLMVSLRLIGNIEQVKLVADTTGLGAGRTYPNLNNAWGIAMVPGEAVWIASNHKGLAVNYDELGNQLRQPVDIPLGGVPFASSPSGIVYNRSGRFMIPSTKQTARLIFSTEDGIIAAWSSGDATVTVADRSASGAIYKGIAIANSGGTDYIYATNFFEGKIDVFDQSFNYVSMPFSDPKIPAGFAPFNIQNIDGKLFVTYAMQKPDKHDDLAGPGNGFIDVFNPDGSFVMRFASQGALNSPWGLVETETGGRPEHILVGNFGDGHINVFDMTGNYVGQLGSAGKPLTINGLWGLAFDEGHEKEFEHGGDGQLYFTAGPNEENHGLFGYLRAGRTVGPESSEIVATHPVVPNGLRASQK